MLACSEEGQSLVAFLCSAATHLSNQVDPPGSALLLNFGQDDLPQVTGAGRTAGENLLDDNVSEAHGVKLLKVLLARFRSASEKRVSRAEAELWRKSQRTCW